METHFELIATLDDLMISFRDIEEDLKIHI